MDQQAKDTDDLDDDEKAEAPKKPSGPRPPSAPRPPSSRLAFLSHVPHPHLGSHRAHDPSKPRAPSAPRPMSGGFSFLKHKPSGKGRWFARCWGVNRVCLCVETRASNPLFKGPQGGKVAAFEKLQESKVHHRVVLALFAVSLLWATSLGVARAIVEGYALPRPKMSDIANKASQLFDRSDLERQGYALCTDSLLENCVTAYDAVSGRLFSCGEFVRDGLGLVFRRI